MQGWDAVSARLSLHWCLKGHLIFVVSGFVLNFPFSELRGASPALPGLFWILRADVWGDASSAGCGWREHRYSGAHRVLSLSVAKDH